MKKQGFTMPEMVITLGVICVLAILLLPVLRHSKSNANEQLFQKALFLAERMVQEIRADEDLYEEGDLSKPAKDELTASTFCENFVEKFKTVSGISCTLHTFVDGQAPDGTFKTMDGIVWKVPITTFAAGSAVIQIDVNGDKNPNCFASEECAEPDRFTMTVYSKTMPEVGEQYDQDDDSDEDPGDGSGDSSGQKFKDPDCSDPYYVDVDGKCGLPLIKTSPHAGGGGGAMHADTMNQAPDMVSE